jgi:hypothetical protein
MIYAIIAAAIGVVALCLHYSTPGRIPSKPKDDTWDHPWDDLSSDGSDGSLPGDPWGETYPGPYDEETDLGCYN